MKNIHKTIGSPALLGLLLILPFVTMEIVNRRQFNEGFPFALFFGLWLNLFAVGLLLLPILQAGLARDRAGVNPVPAPGNASLANPRTAAIVSLGLIAIIASLAVLSSLGWEPLDRLVNGPDPEQTYLPGQILSLALFSLPIAAGMIAAGPVASTLRAGGSLLAHPIHLLIVAGLSVFFAAGLVGLLVDQWPCFMGVPVCD